MLRTVDLDSHIIISLWWCHLYVDAGNISEPGGVFCCCGKCFQVTLLNFLLLLFSCEGYIHRVRPKSTYHNDHPDWVVGKQKEAEDNQTQAHSLIYSCSLETRPQLLLTVNITKIKDIHPRNTTQTHTLILSIYLNYSILMTEMATRHAHINMNIDI